MVATHPCHACGNANGRTCQWCVKTSRVMIPVPIQLQYVVCFGFSSQPTFFDGILTADVVRSLFTYARGAWRSLACEYMVDSQRGYQCDHCWMSSLFVEKHKPIWTHLYKQATAAQRMAVAEDHLVTPTTPNEPESVCSSPNGNRNVPFLEPVFEKQPTSRTADFKRRISEIVSKKEVRMIKKSRQRLPANAVAIMQEWFMDHLRRPYPNDAEKVELAKRTNLSVAQVINWFTNTRKRVWLPSKADNDAIKKRRCPESPYISK